MSDGTIGSVGVRVVPDARDFARRFDEQTQSGMSESGRDARDRWDRGFQSGGDVRVKVNADTKDAQFEMHALRDSIIFLGPAAVPVAGVIAGALAGVIPVAATLALGIKGISDEMKSGQLQGTQYGRDLASLSAEASKLQTISAQGLLSGLDKALQSSGPLFAAVNSDVETMSSQLGEIVAGAGPALLNIFNALNPLFVTFGQVITQGAQELEHFATSGTGLRSFASYVQAELPEVLHVLGELVVLAGHVVEAVAPFGGTVLSGIGLFAQALNAIPVGVLRDLVPVAVAGYAAFRTYGAISGIVTGVNAALGSMTARVEANALAFNAAALQVQSDQAAEAAAVATGQAEMAAAAAESAVDIAAATEGTSSALTAGAVAAAETAIDEADAFQSAADAAVASAAEIAAAAQAAAEASAAAGQKSAVGWASALGPVGALAVGVGILGFALFDSGNDAQKAAQAQDSYTDSVKQSTDALAQVNVQQTVDNLTKNHALDSLRSLQKENIATGVTLNDLAKGVNGTSQQFDQLVSRLKLSGDNKNFALTDDLVGSLKTLRSGLMSRISIQDAINKANHDYQTGLDGGTAATRSQAAALGLTTNAYLDAQTAAKQNTDQTKQQTAAFQLDNAAGSLLQQTLDKLAGKNLSYAQAQNSFQQQLVTLAQTLSDGKKGLDGLSSSAIQNRANLLSLVQGAEQTAEAYGNMTGSSEASRKKLEELRQQIINNAVAHGEDRDAVTKYIDSVLKIPAKVPPTKLDADKTAADEKISALKTEIEAIRQNHVPGLTADTDAATNRIQALQAEINALHGKALSVTVTETTSHNLQGTFNQQVPVAARATGGGAPEGWFSVGEGGPGARPELVHKSGSDVHIFSNAVSKRIIAATGLMAPGFAAGTSGIVGLDPTASEKQALTRAANANISYSVLGQSYTSLQSAINAATRNVKAGITLGVKIDGAELTKFKSAIKGTADQAASAFAPILANLQKLGLKGAANTQLEAMNHELDVQINKRDKIAQQLTDEKAKYTDLANSVKSTFQGSFDITSAGTGPDGSTQVSFGSIYAQAKQSDAKTRQAAAALKDLANKGLNTAELTQLYQAGTGALPQILALDQGSKSQIAALNSQYADITAQGTSAGNFVAGKNYGAQIGTLTKQLASDSSSVEKTFERLEKRIDHLVDVLEHHPTVVTVGKQVVATASASGTRRNARRK